MGLLSGNLGILSYKKCSFSDFAQYVFVDISINALAIKKRYLVFVQERLQLAKTSSESVIVIWNLTQTSKVSFVVKFLLELADIWLKPKKNSALVQITWNLSWFSF